MSEKNTHSILSTVNLNIGYPHKVVATDISLQIFPGELTAIIGINGSGKSTLLKTLIGNLPHKSGMILLDQQPLNHFSSKNIAEHISIVLTNPDFSKNLSVQEVVALGRHPYTNWLGTLTTRDKTAIQNALKQIEIAHLAHRKCNELSDGQLQKVFIARALAQDTEVIILDEPTNHLDLYHKAFVLKLLKNLTKNTHKAVVFATHELNLALQLCDNIVLINQQKVIQDTPTSLIKNELLESVFPKDLIVFDKQSKSFKINKEEHT